MTKQAAARSGLVATLAIAVFALCYLGVGYFTLDPASRSVPVLAAFVTLALIAIELAGQASRRKQPAVADIAEPAGAAWPVLLSVAAGIAGIYLFGFLIALPLYQIAAIRLIGRRSLRTAIVVSLLTSGGIYLVFEWVLSYRLFPGVLFS